jgi:vacuolar protein sorting-associated protein VTA1
VSNLPDIPGTSTFGEVDAPPLLEDKSISLAQKHIHWALSALEFEDVDTAVKELKNSLRYLCAA